MNRLARSSIEPESQLLWGGGASVQLPENIKFYDVSRFRHVPDHQVQNNASRVLIFVQRFLTI